MKQNPITQIIKQTKSHHYSSKIIKHTKRECLLKKHRERRRKKTINRVCSYCHIAKIVADLWLYNQNQQWSYCYPVSHHQNSLHSHSNHHRQFSPSPDDQHQRQHFHLPRYSRHKITQSPEQGKHKRRTTTKPNQAGGATSPVSHPTQRSTNLPLSHSSSPSSSANPPAGPRAISPPLLHRRNQRCKS